MVPYLPHCKRFAELEQRRVTNFVVKLVLVDYVDPVLKVVGVFDKVIAFHALQKGA
jgi:hypothetical protein